MTCLNSWNTKGQNYLRNPHFSTKDRHLSLAEGSWHSILQSKTQAKLMSGVKGDGGASVSPYCSLFILGLLPILQPTARVMELSSKVPPAHCLITIWRPLFQWIRDTLFIPKVRLWCWEFLMWQHCINRGENRSCRRSQSSFHLRWDVSLVSQLQLYSFCLSCSVDIPQPAPRLAPSGQLSPLLASRLSRCATSGDWFLSIWERLGKGLGIFFFFVWSHRHLVIFLPKLCFNPGC